MFGIISNQARGCSLEVINPADHPESAVAQLWWPEYNTPEAIRNTEIGDYFLRQTMIYAPKPRRLPTRLRSLDGLLEWFSRTELPNVANFLGAGGVVDHQFCLYPTPKSSSLHPKVYCDYIDVSSPRHGKKLSEAYNRLLPKDHSLVAMVQKVPGQPLSASHPDYLEGPLLRQNYRRFRQSVGQPYYSDISPSQCLRDPKTGTAILVDIEPLIGV